MSDFAEQLQLQIPRLRRYARALARDAERADDLVQSCLVRALAKQHLFQPGTDLRLWLFTMLHNLHVSNIRRCVREQRGSAAIASVAMSAAEPRDVVDLVDLERAIAKLPDWQRQVLLMIGLEEMSYAEAGALLELPTGTIRSRLGRARAALRQLSDREATAASSKSHGPPPWSSGSRRDIGRTALPFQ